MMIAILLAIFGLAIITCVYLNHKPKKVEVPSGPTPEQIAKAEELDNLSEASQHIVHQYRALPEELQIDDVLPMVKALDVKYGVSTVNAHFNVAQYTEAELAKKREYFLEYSMYGSRYDPYPSQRYVFSWSGSKGDCQHQEDCEYFEYRALHEAILEATKAHREKERALEIAGVRHDLDAVQSLTARLREETGIMKAVAKELT